MNEFLNNLKRQAQENPMLAIIAAGTAVTIVTKFLGTAVDARNSRVWAQEVSRRAMKDALRTR